MQNTKNKETVSSDKNKYLVTYTNEFGHYTDGLNAVETTDIIMASSLGDAWRQIFIDKKLWKRICEWYEVDGSYIPSDAEAKDMYESLLGNDIHIFDSVYEIEIQPVDEMDIRETDT